ncbi:putative carbohydrate esterase family 1 protein [Rosellinia necatrix]|uniref:feruloyl esterase n=1 Tax=Rosellinia necatrix TaxID=77044 RepID=A0A1W2TQZ9_ROSNE|nr:putative carbohydrate esterase family 1 protein [Rosellinia necatrix]
MRFLPTALLMAAITTGVAAAKPSSGCGKTPTLAGNANTTRTITSNGKARTFYVQTPADYDNTRPHRLIFTLHALGGTARQVVAGTGGYYPFYGLPPLVDADANANDTTGAIFVAPDGQNNGWANAGGEDVTFIRAAMAAVEADLCVDQALRFSTGFSYGGAMSYALACALGTELRAVAVLSGNPAISGCAGGEAPVAYLGQHGVADGVLPVAGGREMRDRFARNNGCAAAAQVGEPRAGSGEAHVRTEMAGCRDGFPVVWVAFDGGHTPTPLEGGAATSFTPAETWAFFSRFT